MFEQDTICALSTPPGKGAIALVRLSGKDSIVIVERIFRSSRESKLLTRQKANTLHYGQLVEGEQIIDEVVVSLFKAPHSFTGEDTVEISVHGSVFIQQTVIQLLIKMGARLARPGEFTQRAFLNGKMDLAQAEAIADLISAQTAIAHKMALRQMKGGVSLEIKNLRDQLLHFTTLVELELDFGEEDVEFANRDQLGQLVGTIDQVIRRLIDSFQYGNAIKNGIPVAIIGNTNVGKSTLLNALLNEERAIVSEIAGTTRDVIEDVINIEGVQFRFIDTAGIRHTHDTIENLGIERTYVKIEQAEVVLTLIDATETLNEIVKFLTQMSDRLHQKNSVLVINKIDQANESQIEELGLLGKSMGIPTLMISAKYRKNIELLTNFLVEATHQQGLTENDVIISNSRHLEALIPAREAIKRVIEGLQSDISGDFLAQDIRECLYYLGSITGEIGTEEVLGNIFKNFCIGK